MHRRSRPFTYITRIRMLVVRHQPTDNNVLTDGISEQGAGKGVAKFESRETGKMLNLKYTSFSWRSCFSSRSASLILTPCSQPGNLGSADTQDCSVYKKDCSSTVGKHSDMIRVLGESLLSAVPGVPRCFLTNQKAQVNDKRTWKWTSPDLCLSGPVADWAYRKGLPSPCWVTVRRAPPT